MNFADNTIGSLGGSGSSFEESLRKDIQKRRQESDSFSRARSRRRLMLFAGIGGLIIVLVIIVGGVSPLIIPNRQQTQIFDLGFGITLEMVFIPGGSFQMGSPNSESVRDDDEGPVHRVELDGFWIGKYEVTQAQYRVIMGTNPSHLKGDNRPVERVSWDDAMEFCRKLSQKTGKRFTLPTEAQWEYACRAGTTGPFAFGNCLSTSDANYKGNYPLSGCSKGRYLKSTWDVGSGRANAWGLYDMHGNVWELCLDWYGEDYYSESPRRNPVGPGSGSYRVCRGGGWNLYARGCRSAYRVWSAPSFTSGNLGFRLVMTDSS